MRFQKPSNKAIYSCTASIYEPKCWSLLQKGNKNSVTLLYTPNGWITDAMGYAYSLIERTDLHIFRFSSLFPTQDVTVRCHIISEF